MDQDNNDVLDDEEKERMREDVKLLLIELGIGAMSFEGMPSGLSFQGLLEWCSRLWEKLWVASVDMARMVVEALAGGSSNLPLGGLLGMGGWEIRERVIREVVPALVAALEEKR